jgi:tetratricopeptide (TPR) repeat protein
VSLFKKKLFSGGEESRTSLSKKVQAAPNDPQARQKLGMYLLKQGEIVEGVDQLARAAVMYEKNGFTGKAIAVLRTMLKHDSANVDLKRWLIRLLAQEGLLGDAQVELQQVASGRIRFPSDEKKIEFLRQVAESLAESPLPLLLIVDIFRSQHKYYEAVVEMEKAASLAVSAGMVPEFSDRLRTFASHGARNEDLLETCGFLWLRVGRMEEGVALLARVAETARRGEDFARADEMDRVLAAIRSGSFDASGISSFAAAARTMAAPPSRQAKEPPPPGPEDPAAAPPPFPESSPSEAAEPPSVAPQPPQHESTATAASGRSSPPGAALPDGEDLVRNALGKLREKVRTEMGEDYEARYNLGIAYKEMGLLDEALEEFLVSRRKPELFVGATSLLAETLAEKGDMGAAVGALDEALDREGNDSHRRRDLLYQKGLLLERAHRAEEALAAFLEIFRETPDHRDVRSRIEGRR